VCSFHGGRDEGSVTAASKHGSTDEIAAVMGRQLTDEGLHVTVLRPDEVSDLVGYDAVVLGSAVYGGHWLEPARTLVEVADIVEATAAQARRS
jgi:menaquinone-dependent protoporphyrinogen oxidase